MFESDDSQMDAEGMYKDVRVLEISDDENDGKKSKNRRSEATKDIEEFFPVYHKPNGSKNEKKGRRECKTCLFVIQFDSTIDFDTNSTDFFPYSAGCGIAKQTTLLTDEPSTLRRHMERYHAVIFIPVLQ